MGGIISLLLIFILAIFIFPLLGVLHIIYRFLFGGRTTRYTSSGQTKENPRQKQNHWYTYEKKRKKVFDKTEGEYIEFRRNQRNRIRRKIIILQIIYYLL